MKLNFGIISITIVACMLLFLLPVVGQGPVDIAQTTGTIDGTVVVKYICPVVSYPEDKSFEQQMNETLLKLVSDNPKAQEDSVEWGGGEEVRNYEVTANNGQFLAFHFTYAYRPTGAGSIYINHKNIFFDMQNKRRAALFDILQDTDECKQYIYTQVSLQLGISWYKEDGSGIDFENVALVDEGILITYEKYSIDGASHVLRIAMPKKFYRQEYSSGSAVETEVQVLIDDQKVHFDQAPVIENGRTLVPMRAIFEAMGAVVAWDEQTKTARAHRWTTTISVQIDNAIMNKNGADIVLDVPPQIKNDRTLVPVRAVAEAFGAGVRWDDQIKGVIITTNRKTDPEFYNKLAQDTELNFLLSKVNQSLLYPMKMSVPDFENIQDVPASNLIGMGILLGGNSKTQIDEALLRYFNYRGLQHQSIDRWILKGDTYEMPAFGVESEIEYAIQSTQQSGQTLCVTLEYLEYEDSEGVHSTYQDFASKHEAWTKQTDKRMLDYGRYNLILGMREDAARGKYYVLGKQTIK